MITSAKSSLARIFSANSPVLVAWTSTSLRLSRIFRKRSRIVAWSSTMSIFFSASAMEVPLPLHRRHGRFPGRGLDRRRSLGRRGDPQDAVQLLLEGIDGTGLSQEPVGPARTGLGAQIERRVEQHLGLGLAGLGAGLERLEKAH